MISGHVKLPAIQIWAAGYKAAERGYTDDLVAILNIFSKSSKILKTFDKKAAENFDHLLKSTKAISKNSVLPFVRDPLDIFLAASIYAQRSHAQFKIRSDISYVDSGFLRVRPKDLDYVDCSMNMIRADSLISEFMSPSDKSQALKMIDQFSQNKFELVTTNVGDDILKITGDFNILSEIVKSLKCNLSLWVAPQKNDHGKLINHGLKSRQLGEAMLDIFSANEILVAGIKSEIQLEITAASLADRWLLIESEQIKVFGRLPNLTIDGDRNIAAIDTSSMMSNYLFNTNPLICLEEDSATYLTKTFNWCVPNDSLLWLEAIAK